MLEVDNPQVVAEVKAAFEAYERALISNDIAGLNEMFWKSGHTLRYGTREHERLYGHAAIAEFRIKRGPVDQQRALQNLRITTFGRDFGIANTEYIPENFDKIGRQSQTWVRTDEGWKIVSAHVSFGM